MSDDELRAISAAWDTFPIVGLMPDGAEIRNISPDPKRRNSHVREPSGYFCSPVAYSCRDVETRRWFTPKWATA
jgi:hypothetical protein